MIKAHLTDNIEQVLRKSERLLIFIESIHVLSSGSLRQRGHVHLCQPVGQQILCLSDQGAHC